MNDFVEDQRPQDQALPGLVIERLARLYSLLSRLCTQDAAALAAEPGPPQCLSSRVLEELTGVPGHTIRKDISLLKGLVEPGAAPAAGAAPGGTERGYEAGRLLAWLAAGLGLGRRRKTCLVGLGRLGTAILRKLEEDGGPYRLEAGFDSSQNRRELLSTSVPLYPSRDIPRVVRERGIEIGIIAVPGGAVQEVAARLVEGGVRGIINYAPALVQAPGTVVRNLSLTGELNVVAASFTLQGV